MRIYWFVVGVALGLSIGIFLMAYLECLGVHERRRDKEGDQ
jgi:hypothetical protein